MEARSSTQSNDRNSTGFTERKEEIEGISGGMPVESHE